MNCQKCGSPLNENDLFCKTCGERVVRQTTPSEPNMGVSSLFTPENNAQPTYTAPVVETVAQPTYTTPVAETVAQPTYTAPVLETVAQPTYTTPVVETVAQPTYTTPVVETVAQPTYTTPVVETVSQPTYTAPVLEEKPAFTLEQQMAQPVYNNQGGTISSPVYEDMNKKNNMMKYVIIVLAVAIIALLGVFFSGVMKQEKEITKILEKNSYKVEFKGFTFNIPDEYLYEQEGNVLLISDEESSWVAQVEVEQGSFESIKTNKAQLQSLMQKSGFESTAAKLKTLGGIEFITLEISKNGENGIAAIAKLNSMNFIGITLKTLDNEFDYKLLEKMSPIIESAEYGEKANNIEAGFDVDMNQFSELAK